jgi:hypothetical protein
MDCLKWLGDQKRKKKEKKEEEEHELCPLYL